MRLVGAAGAERARDQGVAIDVAGPRLGERARQREQHRPVIGVSLIVFKGRDHNIPLAFGPYLAIAGAIALFWGPALVKLYFPV